MRLIDDNCTIDHFIPLHLSFRLGSDFVKVTYTFKVVQCEGNLANCWYLIHEEMYSALINILVRTRRCMFFLWEERKHKHCERHYGPSKEDW